MNDTNMQAELDRFLNRNGVLGQFYTLFIKTHSAQTDLCSNGWRWRDKVKCVSWDDDSVKWATLHEMWQKELREAGL